MVVIIEKMNTEKTNTQNKNPQQRISGMPCPNCQNFIPISMHQLMSMNSIFCPVCGLRLDINKNSSERAREALRKLKEIKKEHNETI